MPTHAERRLLTAIEEGRAFRHDPLRYDAEQGRVYMHGQPIAERAPYGMRLNLQGWNTPPVRNAINAVARLWIGRAVLSSLNLLPLGDGQPITVKGWHHYGPAKGPSGSATPPQTARGMDPRARRAPAP